ncbi:MULTISPECIES: hypothetical protein [unclassified Coleofasciculus]|uniref:hypothetical protein n=1 Tax=unclassified Coleofasciculus TaxID=2692782 RepID=UPI00187F5D81|nr:MULTISPECIES: hypothetical protein [unclassified Coleofasciculus]MBE9125632.1 hypothetical protein [Coleofasciculus sp. LEGE 07081]MBE9148786.1 hypothetical protein [Coleofasciculus sp. LEGE 07092]
MTYKDQLKPWCIIHPLANKQTAIILRCRRRSDAEAYLQIFRANNPSIRYQIMLDTAPEAIPNPSN